MSDATPPGPAPASAEPLRLHVGGEEVKAGWKILNIQAKPGVDFIGTATDLSQFADNTVDEIYASHIYEHLDYTGELFTALNEAFRVIKPGGMFKVGVPDLEALARLILAPNLDVQRRWYVMRMIYGGHIDDFDYHYVGYTFQIMGQLLHQTGFRDIKRVVSFGLFQDTTELVYEGTRISLNMQGTKPG